MLPSFLGGFIMSCPTVKQLCKNLVVSSGVTFTDGTLIIDIPAGSYCANKKYCIVVAQTLPEETTINAPVAITIGGDTSTTYPLVNCNCTNVSACSINSRTRYSVCVRTDVSSGVFKLLGKIPCSRCDNFINALPIPTTTTPAMEVSE